MSRRDLFHDVTRPPRFPLGLAAKEERSFSVVAADVRGAAREAETLRLRLADAAQLADRLSAIGEVQLRENRLAHYKAATRAAGAREGRTSSEVEARLQIEVGEGERAARRGG